MSLPYSGTVGRCPVSVYGARVLAETTYPFPCACLNLESDLTSNMNNLHIISNHSRPFYPLSPSSFSQPRYYKDETRWDDFDECMKESAEMIQLHGDRVGSHTAYSSAVIHVNIGHCHLFTICFGTGGDSLYGQFPCDPWAVCIALFLSSIPP